MLIRSEKQLLNFVKYSPIIIITIIAIIANALIYYQNEKNYKKDLVLYEKNFIDTNKQIAKLQVEKVYGEIKRQEKKLEDELRADLKEKIYQAYAIIDNIYKNHIHEGKEKVLTLIKNALREVRFNEGRGYFYIYRMENAVNLLHPIKPEHEGNSLIDYQDVKGKYLLRDITSNLKKADDVFYDVYWVKPNDLKKEYKKITLNKYHKGLDIFIGTGEYVDDFTNKVKEKMLDYIQKISYGKNGYIFVFNYDGVQLAHLKKSYIGQNRIDLTDANGFKITQGIINKAKEGHGFIKYIGTIMPQTGEPAQKLTYVRGHDEWQWAIGAGFYNKELVEYLDTKSKELKEITNQSFEKTILLSFLLSIILFVVAIYISNILKRFFDNYNERIQNEISLNRKKDMILYQQSKMASMGEMIGNIAHQWRQPLSLISTAASKIQLENELKISTKESEGESLEMIMKSTRYLSQTIDDFREFFNPNKIAKEIHTKDLYEKTMQLTSARFMSKDIKVVEAIEEFNLTTYENELIQAIINILNNSIDAFEKKEIEEKLVFFSILRKHECLKDECSKEDCDIEKEDFIEIIIQDNAGGIPEEVKEKIFDAYFTTKHQSQGTGIGLYMTYNIIAKHLNGHINVKNESFTYKDKLYEGAKFTVILPID